MATKEEKEAVVAAQQAEVQAVVAQRSRRESGNLPAPKMRASGDLSRYKVGYTDDPYAIPFQDLSSPGALPPPERVIVAPPTGNPPPRSGGGGGVAPTRRSPAPPAGATPPPRVQPGTTNVRTPYGGYRRVSEGKVPQTGALYETNPSPVRKPPSTGRIDIGKGSIGLDPSGKGGKKGGSYQPTRPAAPSGRVNIGQRGSIGLSTSGTGAKKGGTYKVTAPQSAKTVAAKKVNAAKPARPVSTKAVKK